MGQLISLTLQSGGNLSAYETLPNTECRGGLILIHEVWGLADHIKDVAERLACEGYMILAPDLLSDVINLEEIRDIQEDLFNPEKRNEVQPILRQQMAPTASPAFANDTISKLIDCFNYVYDKPAVKHKVAVIGFCFGGTYSFGLAIKEPRLKLSLPFYGHCDYSVSELAAIKCPIRAFYGQRDENLVNQLPTLESNMKQAGVDFKATVYPNCGHAFFNDTNRFAYNQAAATDAWQKILSDLNTYLV